MKYHHNLRDKDENMNLKFSLTDNFGSIASKSYVTCPCCYNKINIKNLKGGIEK